MIHQFDPVIYPVKLWVVKTRSVEFIRDKFERTSDAAFPELSKNGGACSFNCLVVLKETKKYGFMIVVTTEDEMSIGEIAHEATHMARFIWDHLGENSTGVEADAYLVGWIAGCIGAALKANK